MKPTTGQGINPGAMRELVTIEQRVSQQDAAGEPEEIWLHFLDARAEVVRRPGREVFTSGERNSRVPTTFKLRFQSGVEPLMRLTCRGKLFNVVSAIDPDGRRAELLITAEELVEQPP